MINTDWFHSVLSGVICVFVYPVPGLDMVTGFKHRNACAGSQANISDQLVIQLNLTYESYEDCFFGPWLTCQPWYQVI